MAARIQRAHPGGAGPSQGQAQVWEDLDDDDDEDDDPLGMLPHPGSHFLGQGSGFRRSMMRR